MAIGSSSIMLAGQAFQAGTSILGGMTQARSIQSQAGYNASVYEQQAEMVKAQKKITNYQFNRLAGKTMGDIVAKTAGKGLQLSGSPMAVLADVETQIGIDRAIANYNLDIERNYALSGAAYYRQQGETNAGLARMGGFTNAFSTMLSAGSGFGKGAGVSSGRIIYRPSYSPLAPRSYQSPYGNTYRY